MTLFIALQEFWRDLKAQKLRAFLTILGIMWGTVAVVSLLAFGTGFQRQTVKNMRGIGEGIVIVFSGTTTKPYQGFGVGRSVALYEEDAALLAREIPEIETISPEYSQWQSTVSRGTKQIKPLISGVIPAYSDIRNIFPQPGGRFLNEPDSEQSRHVIFLGDSLKYFLFGSGEAVGQYVYVDGVPFLVIGVMQHKRQDSSYNRRDEDRAYIPASTFSAFFGRKRINNLVYKPRDPRYSAYISRRMYEVLGSKYKFDPSDKNALWVWDTTEFQKIALYFFLGLNLFFGIVGSLTLIVGGIGVANIMYVVVEERTREIGIKRATGARRRDILMQFFGETFFIISLGAVLGLLISVLLVSAANTFSLKDFIGVPVISPLVVLTTVSILGLVGIIAGYFPARRAANLNPIDCLR